MHYLIDRQYVGTQVPRGEQKVNGRKVGLVAFHKIFFSNQKLQS